MADPIDPNELDDLGPPLLTLALAKEHLRIYDTDHDAEVTTKMTHASFIIRDYLKSRNDPAWTYDTVPDVVQAAVMQLLGLLYEHRGDDFAPDNYDANTWAAIERLLMRRRDPALA